MGDAIEEAKETAWAFHESMRGVRHNANGVRRLAGLSIEESEFVIAHEASSAMTGKNSADGTRYLELFGRYYNRRMGDMIRKREDIVEH